jgi:hypothetical protein
MIRIRESFAPLGMTELWWGLNTALEALLQPKSLSGFGAVNGLAAENRP